MYLSCRASTTLTIQKTSHMHVHEHIIHNDAGDINGFLLTIFITPSIHSPNRHQISHQWDYSIQHHLHLMVSFRGTHYFNKLLWHDILTCHSNSIPFFPSFHPLCRISRRQVCCLLCEGIFRSGSWFCVNASPNNSYQMEGDSHLCCFRNL